MAASHCPPCWSDNTRGCSSAVCPGHRGPVVGPGQLSPTRVAQATLLQQVCWEAYLQVFMLKQTAHRCRDIYSTGSICFTNTDKKCLVWQQYFSGKFWLCSSHPAVLGFSAFTSKHWQGWCAYMQSCGLCLCFPVAMMAVLFFSFFSLALLFFLFLVILFLVFRRRQEYSAAQTEISMDC